MDKFFVSVVLPAFNEEEAIEKVIEDIKASMDTSGYEYEILVVDDNSSDKTASLAEGKGVKVVRRPQTGGSGSSRRTGILAAKGEVIVMLDADGSYEAADIPKLLEHFPEYDQVNGARTTEEGTLKILRLPAKWFILKLACYLTGVNIPDLNTGFKAFKKDIMKKYLWVLPNGFSCVTTMTLAFISNGYPVKYIPTTYHKRIGKSKFHPIKDTLAYLKVIFRVVMYFNPMRVFMPLSFIIFLLGLFKSWNSYSSTGSLQESDIIIFMASLMIAVVGLLADLIVAYQNRA